MPEEEKIVTVPHTVKMENRAKLSISGVEDVSGFDEELIILTTSMGALCIRGEELHIERIDLTLGQLDVTGHVNELSYTEPEQKRGLLSGLFG